MTIPESDFIVLRTLFEKVSWEKTIPCPDQRKGGMVMMRPSQWEGYQEKNAAASDCAKTEWAWYIYDPARKVKVSLEAQREIMMAFQATGIRLVMVQNSTFLGGNDSGFGLVENEYRDHLNKLHAMYNSCNKGPD